MLALEARVGGEGHHVGDLLPRLQAHGPLLLGRDAEAAQLQPGGALADAQLHPAREITSRVATVSAVRAGWLYFGGVWRMPWPRRIRSVRAAQADRNTSGAEQCEYSSKKWCSTAQAHVDADLIGDLHLLQGLGEEPLFGVGGPGRGNWCS